MELIKLNAKVRTGRGNGPARVLRRNDQIPAVLYGPGAEPVAISVNTTELRQVMKDSAGSQVMLNLAIEDAGETRSAILKELQTHPVSREFIHADFYEIAMDRKIRVLVPINTTGKSVGVEEGGMLQIIRRELEVLCYPNEIPEFITIDISGLDMGDSIHVEDIPVEGNIEFPHEVDFTILTIVSGKIKEEEVEDEEAEEGEEMAEGETAEETESGAE